MAQQPWRELREEFEKVGAAVRSGHSVLVLGEAGSGKSEFAQALYETFLGEMDCASRASGGVAIATYKGSSKKFFASIAFQLDIPTENEDGKPLTMDALKDEIGENCDENTLLIFPEAKRLTTGIRYWLEDLISEGVRVVCFAVVNPGRDIFLEMLSIELELPSDAYIRIVMAAEAQRQGLKLSKSRLAELQPLAGRNPMLARKVIRNEALGLKQNKPSHTQYIDISPLIIGGLTLLGIVRFVGIGTGNKGLYVIGGMALILVMTLRQLSRVKGSKKKLGE